MGSRVDAGYLVGSKALGHSSYLVVPMLCPQCEQSALGGAWGLSLIWVNMQNDCLSYGPKADRLSGDLCLEATLATVYRTLNVRSEGACPGGSTHWTCPGLAQEEGRTPRAVGLGP